MGVPFALISPRVATGVFSDCEEHRNCANPYCFGRRYRYELHIPTGLGNERRVAWVLANPSIATPDKLDPTVTRCVKWARAWGFGWCDIVNVRAWRETNPKSIPIDPLAIGPRNDGHIVLVASRAELVVCGWGKLGGERGLAVRLLLEDALSGQRKPLHALRLNGDGSPCHPLYLPASAKPILMPDFAALARSGAL